jgi:hypothetical protein
MSTVEKMSLTSSPEAEILRRIEDLIRKLASGHASQSDLQLLYDLQKRRVEMMQPKVNYKKRIPA